jgi:hypothetical protein
MRRKIGLLSVATLLNLLKRLSMENNDIMFPSAIPSEYNDVSYFR